MRGTFISLLILASAATTVPLRSDSVDAKLFVPAGAKAVMTSQPQPDSTTPGPNVAALKSTTAHDIESLRNWNRSRVPTRIGFVRPLAEPIQVSRSTNAHAPWRWRGAVTVANAHRVRLHLTAVNLPADAQLWVYGAADDVVPFDRTLGLGGTLWTPSVAGDTITLEVRSAVGPTSFDITAAADMRPMEQVLPTGSQCLKDATCYGLGDDANGIALMVFASGGSIGICTGGLVLDAANTFIPYFLTAAHCVSTPAEAASLETVWDYRSASCNGPTPSVSTLPTVHGASLLSTTSTSDISLLRLNTTPPGNRWFYGWTSSPAVGATLYRVSHPDGQPARYSTSQVENTSSTCLDAPRSHFIYSKPVLGTVIGGSSGSPVFTTPDLSQIVGVLSGGCPAAADPCGTTVRTLDGSFASAYPAFLKPYLNPTSGGCGTCTPGPNTACLLGNRFKVTMVWKDYSASLNGVGTVITYAENRPEISATLGPMSEAAFFSMYPFAPNSIETLVRMIKGATINDKYWVFLTGFAGAEYTVTIQDTQSCRIWTRTVTAGATSMTKDFAAFPFP